MSRKSIFNQKKVKTPQQRAQAQAALMGRNPNTQRPSGRITPPVMNTNPLPGTSAQPMPNRFNKVMDALNPAPTPNSPPPAPTANNNSPVSLPPVTQPNNTPPIPPAASPASPPPAPPAQPAPAAQASGKPEEPKTIGPAQQMQQMQDKLIQPAQPAKTPAELEQEKKNAAAKNLGSNM